MPRSIRRRLELLEARPAPHAPGPTGDDLFEGFARMVAAGHPLTLGEPFRAAWADFVAARAWLEAHPEEPPGWYRPARPRPERRRGWARWDHPAVHDAVCRVLEAVTEHGSPSPPGPKYKPDGADG